MALDLTKVFKGIQQVKALPATPEKGVIYFVRHHGEDGKPTGNASIYFGGRLYGNVEATKLADLTERLGTAEGKISDIENALGKWTEEFSGNLQTVATVVKGHDDKLSGIEGTVVNAISSAVSGKADSSTVTELAGRVTTAEGAIDAIEESLAEGGATAQAIAAAQKKADDAQADVDALEIVVGTKAAQSDLDALAGRVSTAEGAIDDIEESLAEGGATAQAIAAAQKKADDAYDLADAAQTAQEVSDAINTAISGLTADRHTHSNKELLDTYTQTEANLADAVAKKHEHSNKTELDKIAEGDKARWDAAAQDVEDFFNGALEDGAEQVKDTLREIQDYINSDASAAATMAENITKAQNAADKAQDEVDALEVLVGTGFSETKTVASEIARVEGIADAAQTAQEVSDAINTAISGLTADRHTHSNKELLDTYTQTEANLADAVAKKHEHSNKTELDKIAEGDKDKWDAIAANGVTKINVVDGDDYLSFGHWDDVQNPTGIYDAGLSVSTDLESVSINQKYVADAYAVKSYVDSHAIYYGGDDAE